MEDFMIGKTFHDLTVVSYVKVKSNGKHYGKHYLCICICGKNSIVRGDHLRNGNTKSCGCLQKKTASKLNSTHGQTNSITYKSWESMRGRCNNKNHEEYPNYGARGITVCPRWDSFELFLEDMGERPSLSYSIDRYPNNETGIYEKSNCRWATMEEQQRNKRTNVWIVHNGKKMVQSDWAAYIGIHLSTLRLHLKTETISEVMEHFKERLS